MACLERSYGSRNDRTPFTDRLLTVSGRFLALDFEFQTLEFPLWNMPTQTIEQLLGDKADFLLGFKNPKISKERLHLPGPDVVDRIFAVSDRNNRVLCNLQRIISHGRLGSTGYLSILPVDQGIEHSAGASFAKNPDYFDAENIVRLAIEGGCNAVASTFGALGAGS